MKTTWVGLSVFLSLDTPLSSVHMDPSSHDSCPGFLTHNLDICDKNPGMMINPPYVCSSQECYFLLQAFYVYSWVLPTSVLCHQFQISKGLSLTVPHTDLSSCLNTSVLSRVHNHARFFFFFFLQIFHHFAVVRIPTVLFYSFLYPK